MTAQEYIRPSPAQRMGSSAVSPSEKRTEDSVRTGMETFAVLFPQQEDERKGLVESF